MAQKWYQKVSVISAIIGAIASIIVACIFVGHSRSQLKQDNAKYQDRINSLKETLDEKNAKIQLLETQLVPFKTIALEKYNEFSENEALKKLANDLENIKKYLNPLKQKIIDAEANILLKFYDKEKKIDGGTYFFVGTTINLHFIKNNESLLCLRGNANTIQRNDKSDEVVYNATLKIFDEYSKIGEPIEILLETDFIQIRLSDVPTDSIVLNGKVSIKINAKQKFNFIIPEQKMYKDMIGLKGIREQMEKNYTNLF